MAHPREGSAMSRFAGDAVSSTELHTRTSEAISRTREVHTLAVTHYNEVDAYLVSPQRMADMHRALASASERERELADTLPLILAAVAAGVAIPSTTLDRVLPGLDHSLAAVAEFAASHPVRMHTGEDGEPITRGHLRGTPGPIFESGDDEDLNYDA